MFIQICKKCNRIARVTNVPMGPNIKYSILYRDKPERHNDFCVPNVEVSYASIPKRFNILEL